MRNCWISELIEYELVLQVTHSLTNLVVCLFVCLFVCFFVFWFVSLFACYFVLVSLAFTNNLRSRWFVREDLENSDVLNSFPVFCSLFVVVHCVNHFAQFLKGAFLILSIVPFSIVQKLESQMRDVAYGTKQYKTAPSEVIQTRDLASHRNSILFLCLMALCNLGPFKT